MAVVENRFVCDLSKPVQAQALKGNVFSLDNLGSRLSVLIYNNGQPATISGSVTANCILPDGSTVNVNGGLTTENGRSKAYVDIPQSCLLIPGILKIAIKCTSSSVITTLAAIVANVYMTKTDNVITPSQQIINDWNAEVSAAIATQNAAIANQDTKINDLKSALNTIPNDFDNYIGINTENLLLHVNTVAGRVRTTDGAVEQGQWGTLATDFIPVEGNKTYYINWNYYSSSNYGLAYFKADKSYDSGEKEIVSGYSESTQNRDFSFTTPSTASYVRITIPTTYYSNAIMSAVDFIQNCTENVFEYSQSDLISKSINSSGTVEDSSNHYAVRVPVVGCRYIKLTNLRFGSGQKSIAFFTANNSLLYAEGTMRSTSAIVTQVFKVPDTADYCIVSSRINGDFCRLDVIRYVNVHESLKELLDSDGNIENKIAIINPIREMIKYSFVQEAHINLFNKYLDGYRVNTANGNIESNSGTFASDYIPVAPGERYYLNFSYYSLGNYGMAFYNNVKTFISGSGIKEGTKTSKNEFSFVVPEGAYYLRFTGSTNVRIASDVTLKDVSDITNFYERNLIINVSEYQKKAISSTGEIVDDTSFRSVIIPVSDYKYVKATTKWLSGGGYQSLAFYQTDGTYISGSGGMGTSGERRTRTYLVPADAAYCVVCDRINDLYPDVSVYDTPYNYIIKNKEYGEQLREWIINEQPLKNFTYTGEKVVLDPSFSCVRYGGSVIPGVSTSITEPTTTLYRQACAVYGNYLFQGYDKGYIKVYDISDMNNIQYIDDFELANYSSNIHCAVLSFAPSIISGNDFPLLYIEYGIHIDNELSCIVQKVTTNSAELVQKIIFDIGMPGNADIFPLIGDDNKLYLFAMEKQAHDAHFYVFNVPNVSNSEVTLTLEDTIDSWVDEDAYYTYNQIQSAMVRNGKYYMLYGTHQTAKRGIAVYNLTTHKVVSNVDLTNAEPQEPEGIAVYKGSMLLSINDAGGIYKIDF